MLALCCWSAVVSSSIIPAPRTLFDSRERNFVERFVLETRHILMQNRELELSPSVIVLLLIVVCLVVGQVNVAPPCSRDTEPLIGI